MPPAERTAVHGPTRRDPKLLWIVGGLLLAARIALGINEERHPSPKPDLVSWVEIEEAAERSRETGRPILYDFTAEWCGPCQRMEREVYGDERQAEAISKLVVPVKVLDRQREEGRNPPVVDSLQRAHRVTAFPTLVVVDSAGRAIERLEGYTSARDVISFVSRAGTAHRLRQRDGVRLSFP